VKKKVLTAETKERKKRTKDKKRREMKKVSISAVVLSLFIYFM
jgi:hypothetical protein